MGLRMDRIGSVANMSMAVAYTASSADMQLARRHLVAVPPTRVDLLVQGRKSAAGLVFPPR